MPSNTYHAASTCNVRHEHTIPNSRPAHVNVNSESNAIHSVAAVMVVPLPHGPERLAPPRMRFHDVDSATPGR
eukprot:14123947-Alexandrium_andersonii.AAC.1